jgi:hypothetical protein
MKLAPTALLFHTEEPILIGRSRSVATKIGIDFGRTYQQLYEEWWSGQRKRPRSEKITEEVRESIGRAVELRTNLVSYSYRPFVSGYAVCDKILFEALGRTLGGGTRPRPEILAAFSQNAKGIAVSPAPMDLGDTLTRFASFAWHLPDNDLSSRGNAMVHCDRFPDEQRGADWDSTARTNVHSELEAIFGGQSAAEEVLFYTYAVLSSNEYLDAFETVLYSESRPEEPPRIPIAADSDLRRNLVNIGRRIALCERDDHAVEPLACVRTSWPETADEMRLSRVKVREDEGKIRLEGADGQVAEVTGIPPEVLTLRISGHDVVLGWLRERLYTYLRRTFRPADMHSLVIVLSRIAEQRHLIEESDLLVRKLLDPQALVPTVELPRLE